MERLGPEGAAFEPPMPGAATMTTAAASVNNQERFQIPGISDTLPWTYTRNDPFYANDRTVIATFDVDYKKLDEAKEWLTILFLVPFVAIAVMFALLPDPTLGVVLTVVVLLVVILSRIGYYRNLYVSSRRRIAVSRNGVYMDETEGIDRTHLICRHSVMFKAIRSCRMENAGCIQSSYHVVIKEIVDACDEKDYFIIDLKEGPQFVDLVNAMVRRERPVPAKTANRNRNEADEDRIDTPAIPVAEVI